MKKVIGKNAPIRKDLNRPKVVPSIPSQTTAPPEDKTMVSVDRDEDAASDGITYRKADYIKLLEKNANPLVGPGSYDPKVKKMKIASIDWSKSPKRFKLKEAGVSRNKQPQTYAPSTYVPHLY